MWENCQTLTGCEFEFEHCHTPNCRVTGNNTLAAITCKKVKRTSLTSFLMHHVLLSTVIIDAVDGEMCRMPLTEGRLKSPKQCIAFFRIIRN